MSAARQRTAFPQEDGPFSWRAGGYYSVTYSELMQFSKV